MHRDLADPFRFGRNVCPHCLHVFNGSGGNWRRSTRMAQAGLHVVRVNRGTSGAIRRRQPRQAV
jgi:hypothetical protein